MCLRCDTKHPLDDFYPNKLWVSQQYRDTWCKECIKKYVHTKEDLKRYLYENNRKLTEAGWAAAQKKSKYALSTNRKYLDPDTPQEDKDKIQEEEEVKAYFQIMNCSYAYEYEENMRVAGEISDRDEVNHEFTPEEDKPYYDKVWHGWFSPTQVEVLEEIYAQYEQDFVLDNVSIRDYARKVAKASLNADIAEDKMRRGQITQKEYSDAVKIYDDLSKSSNFAACRRKPGENTGMGSLGEIILKMEVDGHLDFNPYAFPEDNVDYVIHDYRHTIAAVGMDIH